MEITLYSNCTTRTHTDPSQNGLILYTQEQVEIKPGTTILVQTDLSGDIPQFCEVWTRGIDNLFEGLPIKVEKYFIENGNNEDIMVKITHTGKFINVSDTQKKQFESQGIRLKSESKPYYETIVIDKGLIIGYLEGRDFNGRPIEFSVSAVSYINNQGRR